jgi:hypothetical protein
MNAPTDTPLPDLDDARIAAMERTVFARIGDEVADRRRRRVRGWTIGGAAAAVVLLAAIIAPAVTSGLTTQNTATSYDSSFSGSDGFGVQSVPEGAIGGAESAPLEVMPGAAGGSAADAGAATGTDREIVSNASASIVVDDVRAAADEISAAAEARGGYVESRSVGQTGAMPAEGGAMIEPAMPYGAGDGWITVRVPADQLTAAVAALDEVGEVTTSTVSAQDVTDQAIDLRARISAAEASVARLTELMAQAESTADLIAAESALQERQAALDADRQQLAFLEGQVDLASLSVQLTLHTVAVEADPAGFGDGLVAGWNGLVATLNGIVISLGFLLPWIAVLAVAAAIVWGVRRGVRRARGRRASATEGEAGE